jgi:hypothetical protein
MLQAEDGTMVGPAGGSTQPDTTVNPSPAEQILAAAGLELVNFGYQEDGPEPPDTVCLVSAQDALRLRQNPELRDPCTAALQYINARHAEVCPSDLAPGGRVLRATRDIKEGGTVLRERPLLVTPSPLPEELINLLPWVVWHMSDSRARAFRELHECYEYAPPGRLLDAARLYGIRGTNAWGCELEAGGEEVNMVFDWMSRASHSCSENAVFIWDPYVSLSSRRFAVHAGQTEAGADPCAGTRSAASSGLCAP